MRRKFSELSMRLETLAIFRKLLDDPVIAKLRTLFLLTEESEDERQVISCFSSFISALYEKTPDLSKYIKSLILNDDNLYIRQKSAGKEISPTIESCLYAELELFQEISQLKVPDIKSAIGYHGFLPEWETSHCDLKGEYKKQIEKLPVKGFGIFAKYRSFSVKDGEFIPILFPDNQSLSDLFGYRKEREQVIKNTEAFLEGKEASDMLLYGDAGTGKSSTIKAIVNEYAPKGLRLVEIRKSQIFDIPKVTEKLSGNPLKFIIYIDDLSFSGNNENFSSLKAILEGSAVSRSSNILIYATSNRRHLLKETSAERQGDDLHINETLQETMSLAARFGLTVAFQKPDKDTYLYITKELAKKYGLDMSDEELFKKAEAHAIRTNGRTPRAAKQFIELQKTGL
ncbi:MAG TPA: ATP-binding protein [Bacillota bacterium]|nr:ATP-binding protein [Bacillota bacterium]HUM55771.1 ATP-binding protein [Bacillota bacterium]